MTRPEQALLPCICGAVVDADECPYPHGREDGFWKIVCTNTDCDWCVISTSPERAIASWNRREALLSRAATTQAGEVDGWEIVRHTNGSISVWCSDGSGVVVDGVFRDTGSGEIASIILFKLAEALLSQPPIKSSYSNKETAEERTAQPQEREPRAEDFKRAVCELLDPAEWKLIEARARELARK
jgi:hypothetical protein